MQLKFYHLLIPLTCVIKFKISTGRYGTLCIRENPGCLFIATNLDAVGNMTDLQEWPGIRFFFCPFTHWAQFQWLIDIFTWQLFWLSGAGCMVGAISSSTEKKPVVVGKPSTFMMDFLLKKLVTQVEFYTIKFYQSISIIFLWSLIFILNSNVFVWSS